MPRKKKNTPVPDRDWKAEHTEVLSDMLHEQSGKLEDWLIDTIRMLSKVLCVTGDVETSHGTVHRTLKGDVVIGNPQVFVESLHFRDIDDVINDVSCAVYVMGHGYEEKTDEKA